jgi:hypothetical protein
MRDSWSLVERRAAVPVLPQHLFGHRAYTTLLTAGLSFQVATLPVGISRRCTSSTAAATRPPPPGCCSCRSGTTAGNRLTTTTALHPGPSMAGITIATQPGAPRTDMGIATASSAQLRLPFNVSTSHCGFCQP